MNRGTAAGDQMQTLLPIGALAMNRQLTQSSGGVGSFNQILANATFGLAAKRLVASGSNSLNK